MNELPAEREISFVTHTGSTVTIGYSPQDFALVKEALGCSERLLDSKEMHKNHVNCLRASIYSIETDSLTIKKPQTQDAFDRLPFDLVMYIYIKVNDDFLCLEGVGASQFIN